MIEASQLGNGFINDTEDQVNDLSGITVPVLVRYSHFDKSVPSRNAKRVAAEVATCDLYEVPSDTHLIWIGSYAGGRLAAAIVISQVLLSPAVRARC
jgi:pimeloyl-ACP methyl ester carboxylesterase